MSDFSAILASAGQGDTKAAADLLPLVYAELRRLAAARLACESPGQTLQATALVHEAFLRLVGPDAAARFEDRAHFFAAAAEAMRRILINRARDKGRLKRGGDRSRVDLAQLSVADEAPDEHVLAVGEALERLEHQNKPCADLVKLRFFAGLTMDEAAAALGISTRTAHRYWEFARAWLYDDLAEN